MSGDRLRLGVILRLCLVPVKYFLENKNFPEMLFSGKQNIFECLVALWKLLDENIFMCLVLFWKCYFPTNFLHFLSYFLSIQTNFITENFKITAKFQSTEQITAKYPSLATTNNNPQPPKFIPTTETTPHTTETPIQPTAANSGNQKPQLTASKQNPPPHNRKTTKTPPPQQKKSKSHRNQNRTEREIRSWVSGKVEGSRSKISGSKALALALGWRLWVHGMIWALGSPVRSKIGSWVHGAKSLGRQWSRSSWVAGDGLSLLPLSLSLSLCARARSHSHSHSLSLCFPENDIWR